MKSSNSKELIGKENIDGGLVGGASLDAKEFAAIIKSAVQEEVIIMKKPFMLMILDGWGLNDNLNEKNAIREVNPENFNYYWENYPKTILDRKSTRLNSSH